MKSFYAFSIMLAASTSAEYMTQSEAEIRTFTKVDRVRFQCTFLVLHLIAVIFRLTLCFPFHGCHFTVPLTGEEWKRQFQGIQGWVIKVFQGE